MTKPIPMQERPMRNGEPKPRVSHERMVTIGKQMLRDTRRERVMLAREIAAARTAVLKQIHGEKTKLKCNSIDVFAEWEDKKATTMKEIRAKALEITRDRFDARYGEKGYAAADQVFGPAPEEGPEAWEEDVDAEEEE